jgi:hypothetical protein
MVDAHYFFSPNIRSANGTPTTPANTAMAIPTQAAAFMPAILA